MTKIKLAILPGDGIGKTVTMASLEIFDTLNIPVEMFFADIGWECWKKEGNAISQHTWNIINFCDATLLGATTSKPENEAYHELAEKFKVFPPVYVSPIVQLRQRLDLYANVRPCFKIMGEGEDFNFVIIRENTEGLYAGLDYYPIPDSLTSFISKHPRWNHISSSSASCTLRLQTEIGLKRLFIFAFNYAKKENFKRVTFADKPNVLRKSSSFARTIFEDIAKTYSDIKADIYNVDAVALWMVKKPKDFGVIVAENMFGDILSDLGAGIMGGLGFAPSANIGEKTCYFEPVHGSAPQVKENTANPSAMFLTIALLLENFNYISEANRIKQAVIEIVKERQAVTYDLGGTASTQRMAEEIICRCTNANNRKNRTVFSR